MSMTPDTPTQAAALPDLLPCPFCGHRTAMKLWADSDLWAEQHDDGEPFPHSEAWQVVCDASNPGGPGGCGAGGGFKPSELEAVEAWNRRAAQQALQEACAERDALRADAERWRTLAPLLTWAWGGEGKVNWYAQIEMPEPDVSEGVLRPGSVIAELGRALDAINGARKEGA